MNNSHFGSHFKKVYSKVYGGNNVLLPGNAIIIFWWFERNKILLPHPLVKLSIVGSLCDRQVSCSSTDLEGLNFEFCVWRAVSSHSSHHRREVILAQFSLYVHKRGLFHLFSARHPSIRYPRGNAVFRTMQI